MELGRVHIHTKPREQRKWHRYNKIKRKSSRSRKIFPLFAPVRIFSEVNIVVHIEILCEDGLSLFFSVLDWREKGFGPRVFQRSMPVKKFMVSDARNHNQKN